MGTDLSADLHDMDDRIQALEQASLRADSLEPRLSEFGQVTKVRLDALEKRMGRRETQAEGLQEALTILRSTSGGAQGAIRTTEAKLSTIELDVRGIKKTITGIISWCSAGERQIVVLCSTSDTKLK